MFTGIVNNWTSVVGTAIPFVTKTSSNQKVTNNAGVLSLNKSGYYDIDASITLYGVQGDIIVSLYADGVETQTFAEASTSSATDIVNVSIVDAIKVVLAEYPSVGTISLKVDTAGLNVSGVVRVQLIM